MTGGHNMNFIEEALGKKGHMSADDFLQAMADIYKNPEVRKSLTAYPQFVQDVIYIIDYDSEIQMEGLEGFLTDSTKQFFNETYCALMNCGALTEAEILKKAQKLICLIDEIDEDNYDAQFEQLQKQVALYNDYECFWNLVRAYIDREWSRII